MMNKIKVASLILLAFGGILLRPLAAQALLTAEPDPKTIDSDNDGLTDYQETEIYHTNPTNADTDGDGFNDGDEVKAGFDPNSKGADKLQKIINVDLKSQSLTYSLGPYNIDTFKISSGVRNKPTPKGTFHVLEKKPTVDYKGANYDYPDTKWNLEFKLSSLGNYYIHGAPWNKHMGTPGSHGCVNVTYADVEPLYNWADVGTEIIIK